MPGWDDVLAAAGGGLDGAARHMDKRDDRALDKEKLAQQAELARLREEVKVMLATMTEGGRNDRFGKPSGNVQLQQQGATERTGMQQTGATTRTGMQQEGANTRATMRDATTRRGQDFGQENFGKTNARLWEGLRMGDQRAQERNWLTERDQDIDLDLGNRRIDEGGDSKAIGYALEAYRAELARRRAGQQVGQDTGDVPDFKSWLDSSQDPEIFPSVRRLFGGNAPAPAAPTPAPVMAPRAAPRARPQAPAAAPAAAPAPAATPQAAASRFKAGQSVKLKNGKTVTIKKINPDGTFEY